MMENGEEMFEMATAYKLGPMVLNMKVRILFLYLFENQILGEWRNNKAHGKGKFWHVDGDIFEGQWADDKANGYGTYTHTNGAKYEGQWKDDLQNGYGIETWLDGSKYEGLYKQGKKHGEGRRKLF